MEITQREGLWYASQKNESGCVCLGFSPYRGDAIQYCQELLNKGKIVVEKVND